MGQAKSWSGRHQGARGMPRPEGTRPARRILNRGVGFERSCAESWSGRHRGARGMPDAAASGQRSEFFRKAMVAWGQVMCLARCRARDLRGERVEGLTAGNGMASGENTIAVLR